VKRDFLIIRAILQRVEAHDGVTRAPLDGIEASPEVIAAHVELMIGAGLLIGEADPAASPPVAAAHRLTSEGHDLLALGGETAWRQALDRLDQILGGATLALLRDELLAFARFKLGS